jgi:hypothetical protein
MDDDTVAEIGDEHRDRVWRDRNGDYWKWYDDGERRGWKYQSPHNRWRFGGMHIRNCGPYTLVAHRTPDNDGGPTELVECGICEMDGVHKVHTVDGRQVDTWTHPDGETCAVADLT